MYNSAKEFVVFILCVCFSSSTTQKRLGQLSLLVIWKWLRKQNSWRCM